MSKNPIDTLIDDVMEFVLSQFPEDVVTHFANARREFLLGVKECVDHCIDESLERMDAHVAGAKARRQAREHPNTTHVTVEEEDEAAGAYA